MLDTPGTGGGTPSPVTTGGTTASTYTVPFSSVTTDAIRNFRFLVQFLPHGGGNSWFSGTMGFTNVSGLAVTVDPIAYREGGFNTNMHYLPGQASFQPLQFTRGQTLGGSANATWMKKLFIAVQGNGGGTLGSEFRANIDIHVLSHPNPKGTAGSNSANAVDAYTLHRSMSFRVYNAWITSLVYGDLSAGGNGLMVEGMSVVHEGFDVTYTTNYTDQPAALIDA